MSKLKWSKSKWSDDEVFVLQTAVKIHGKDWKYISENYFTNRTRKQCGERWRQHSNPNLNMKPWSERETEHLFHLFNKFGPKWHIISKQLKTNRATTNVKNQFKIRKHAYQHILCESSK